MLTRSSNPNTCLISSSSKWVIDSGTTNHMADNSSLFTTFQLYSSTSTVTLADGSTSCMLESRTIHPTPLITLTSVLSLPQFSFNLISTSKLIRTLNCSISFFPDNCLIKDLFTKRIIGRGRIQHRIQFLVITFLLFSVKVNVNVHVQLSSFCSYNHFSSHSCSFFCILRFYFIA